MAPDDEMMTACANFRSVCEHGGHALGQKLHEADRWIAATALFGRNHLRAHAARDPARQPASDNA